MMKIDEVPEIYDGVKDEVRAATQEDIDELHAFLQCERDFRLLVRDISNEHIFSRRAQLIKAAKDAIEQC
jgi:hypothetical protein